MMIFWLKLKLFESKSQNHPSSISNWGYSAINETFEIICEGLKQSEILNKKHEYILAIHPQSQSR